MWRATRACTRALRRFTSNSAEAQPTTTPPPPPPHPPPRSNRASNITIGVFGASAAAIAGALWYEEATADEAIAERIMRWQTVPQGALRLSDSFVPQRSAIDAIGEFLTQALTPSSTSSTASQARVLGVYGPSLSGKSTACKAVIGQLIRESAARESAAAAAAAAPPPVYASPLLGNLPADERLRLVYVPVGDNFRIARRTTSLLADVLGYRPLYFFLLSMIPEHVRFDSAAADFAEAMASLERACLALRARDRVRVVCVIENVHRIVNSQHRMLLGAELVTGSIGGGGPVQATTETPTMTGAPTFSQRPVQTMAATPTGDGAEYVNMNQAMQGAPEGDALIAELTHALRRASTSHSFDTVFTCSSPLSVLKYRRAFGDSQALRLHHQTELTLDEARQLARMRLERFRDMAVQNITAAAAAASAAAASAAATEVTEQRAAVPRSAVHGPPMGQAPSVDRHAARADETPRRSAHPDFLFTGASFKRKRPGVGDDVASDEAASIQRLPQWSDAEFERIVAMVGLSPVFLRTVFHAHAPLDQARRVLGARMLSMTPYVFTNNFAVEEAWQHGGTPVLRKLIAQRCRTTALLERVYADSRPARGLVCSPTTAISEADERECRATAAALCPLSARKAAGGDQENRVSFADVSSSPLVALMLESGILDADVDTDRVRIATMAHVRAFERLRARQQMPQVCRSCEVALQTDGGDEALVDAAAQLSLALSSNMWL